MNSGNSFQQHYHISERFRRATKSGKFSRAVWEFDVVLISILEQKIIQIKDIASIFTHFCA